MQRLIWAILLTMVSLIVANGCGCRRQCLVSGSAAPPCGAVPPPPPGTLPPPPATTYPPQ